MRNNENLHNPEFQIQNEDFPALPGAVNSPSDLSSITVPVSTVCLVTFPKRFVLIEMHISPLVKLVQMINKGLKIILGKRT